MNDIFSIKSIIDQQLVRIYMQSILSHNDRFIRGVEVLAKVLHPDTGAIIEQDDLFKQAKKENKLVELELFIVKKSIEGLALIHKKEPKALLFIEIQECLIQESETADLVESIIKESGIEISSIVLGIGNSNWEVLDKVIHFIEKYRKLGCYISVDNIGRNYFNVDRILLFNPDIIKLNHKYLFELIEDVKSVDKLKRIEYIKRMYKYINRIAHEMGMIVVESGIDNDKALEYAHEQGAQYYQGRYVSEPMFITEDTVDSILNVEKSIERVKKYGEEVVLKDTRPFMNKMVAYLNIIKEKSKRWSKESINESIYKLFRDDPSIENAWIMNKQGIQISKAMINNEGFSLRNANIFRIHDKGHSYVDQTFYKLIKDGLLDVWITEPYVSLLTNRICVTTSSYIELEGEASLIMCLVFNCEQYKKAHVSSKWL